MAKHFCIECEYCDLRIDVNGDSNYRCRKTEAQLVSNILMRPACRDFIPMVSWRMQDR